VTGGGWVWSKMQGEEMKGKKKVEERKVRKRKCDEET